MKLLVQRVQQAAVEVLGNNIASIQSGLLVFVGFEQTDNEQLIDKALNKLFNYRVFADDLGKMNLNVQQARGEILLVSQFTLVANTQKGMRPSFSEGATPEQGLTLFNSMVEKAKATAIVPVTSGQYAADMQISLINDGPVTFFFDIH